MWLAERTQNSEQFPTRYLDGIDDAIWCAPCVPRSAAKLTLSITRLSLALSLALCLLPSISYSVFACTMLAGGRWSPSLRSDTATRCATLSPPPPPSPPLLRSSSPPHRLTSSPPPPHLHLLTATRCLRRPPASWSASSGCSLVSSCTRSYAVTWRAPSVHCVSPQLWSVATVQHCEMSADHCPLRKMSAELRLRAY